MKKPSSLKWAKGLAIFQIIISTAVVTLLIWLVDATPQNSFLAGLKQGMDEALTQGGIYYYDYEMAGYLAAMPLLGIIASIITLVAINRHTKKWGYTAMAALAIHALGVMINGGEPSLSIIIFFLFFAKSARTYFGMMKDELASETPKPI
tara:strand:+ start:505 stop:954 length:450 start_codon:yes stop_codon:yes gene_type:complete